MERTEKRPEIPALTGLRGVAAYSVLLAHALSYSGVKNDAITRLAYFAMSLFFILSGCVIHYNYADSFKAGNFRAAVSGFFVARFARLYPLYLIGLILSVSSVPGLYLLFIPLTGLVRRLRFSPAMLAIFCAGAFGMMLLVSVFSSAMGYRPKRLTLE